MILVGGGGAQNLPRAARFSGFRCDWKRRWRGQRFLSHRVEGQSLWIQLVVGGSAPASAAMRRRALML